MLRWCAYCQGFQGEVAPLDALTTTHGVCAACLSKGMRQLNREIPHAHRLRAIQGRLYEAGKTADNDAASSIVHFAIGAGLRPIDILVGLITPLLYRIGNEWEAGQITIADQQRFSGFCEFVYKLIQLEVRPVEAKKLVSRRFVFLFNVPGNDHNLGIRILSLWLESKGIETREFRQPPTAEELMALIAESKPSAILFSLSMEGQKAHLYEIARQIEALPSPRPALIVGGYAIKRGLIAPIDGALFIETLNDLDRLIWSLK